MLKYIFSALLCMLISTCAKGKPVRIVEEEADREAIVAQVYQLCKASLGPVAEILIKKQVSESIAMFSKREDRIAATILVCVESGFNQGAKSGSGAIGLTQIIPKYAAEFARDCYLSTKPVDLWVPEVNLKTGFCQFRKLLTQYKGKYSMALAAYNAGAGSKTVKKLQQGESINQETANYISKFWTLWEEFKHAEASAKKVGSSVESGSSDPVVILGVD